MKAQQLALIKKDFRSMTSNRQVFMVMLMVPLALAIVLPSIFVLVTVLAPESASDFEALLAMLPVPTGESSQEQMILGLVLNQIMPAFFLIIPVMASSVMAASSFVGEKEKHTLETLLYSPLSLKQLFQAKILAGFAVGMMVSYISFAAMMLVLEIEMVLLTGRGLMPDISWLVILLLIAPAVHRRNRAGLCEGANHGRGAAARGIPDFPDTCAHHRPIHRGHSGKAGTPAGIGYRFGGA